MYAKFQPFSALRYWRPARLAQETTGTITGTVKDQSGALVTTATVRAINAETGFSRTAKAGGQGDYTLPYLPVGNYKVEFTAAGFKKYVQDNVTLTVDQAVAVNATLQVGAADQTVEVSTAPPLIDTSSAEMGRLVQPEEITNLPLVNRNAYNELNLTVGVQANSTSGFSNPSGTPNFVSGAPSTDVQLNGSIDGGDAMVAFYLDGGLNMNSVRNYGNAVPNPDAIQEFRVETTDFSAEYGRFSGASSPL